jgi:predicted SAM-dependent methyltransferase
MTAKTLLQFVAWEIINPLSLSVGRKRIRIGKDVCGVNVGCGLDNPPGWLGLDGGVFVILKRLPEPMVRGIFRFLNTSRNMDVTAYLRRLKATDIVHCDLRKGMPFETDSVPNIYSSHFFEHLPGDEALRLMKECWRVMVPAGLIRICVPDLDEEVLKIRDAVRAYEAGDAGPIQPFVTDSRSGFLSNYSSHRQMYNFLELKRLLEEAGFVDVTHSGFREGRMRDVALLDTRSGLHVEARKPSIR